MKNFNVILLGIIPLYFAFATNALSSDNHHPTELHGYWETQSVTVDGNADNGDEGSYLILRPNGTYRIAKIGRKPEDTWSVNTDNLLVLMYNGQLMMASNWKIDDDKLTLYYTQGNAKIAIKYLKQNLQKEPKAPDET